MNGTYSFAPSLSFESEHSVTFVHDTFLFNLLLMDDECSRHVCMLIHINTYGFGGFYGMKA
jgi:hypothetical protein